MKYIVLGLGKSGTSACQFLLKEGHQVIATDDKVQTVPEGASFVSGDALDVTNCDAVIISPGVPLTHPVATKAVAHGIDLFCDVELALRWVAKNPPPILAITGTNGKTTTTMLSCHMLNAAGLHAKVAGNIGVPLLDEIQKAKDPLVVELSSFQLETMKTPAIEAGCILNITPNHLDRHASMQEYTQAKLRLERCIKSGGEFWLHEGLKSHSTGALCFGFDPASELYTDTKELFRFGQKEAPLPQKLRGTRSHNVENFLAAYALSRHWDIDPEVAVKAYDSFSKPKHRLEYVRTWNGIDFYDDSKATSVDAVLRAVESIESPIVLIAGGVHKGYPYKAWQKAFSQKVRGVVLIGQAARFIENDLQNSVPVVHANSFDEAIILATQLAQPGDAVLLSPGCSSFDMFSSYEERGKKFQEQVFQL